MAIALIAVSLRIQQRVAPPAISAPFAVKTGRMMDALDALARDTTKKDRNCKRNCHKKIQKRNFKHKLCGDIPNHQQYTIRQGERLNKFL